TDTAGAVLGVVTDRDLALRVLGERLPSDTPVLAIMTPGPFLSCRPDDSLQSLETRMAEAKRPRAVVVDPCGKLVGVISLSDIARVETSLLHVGELLRAITD